MSPAECSSAIARDFGLDPKKFGFDRDHSAHPPKQRGKAQHQFALDRRLRVIVRDDSGLESPVVLGILQPVNHGFRSEAMAEGIAPRPLLFVVGLRPGAAQRIPAIGFDLSK
jgi:hypothetical protein